MARRKSKLNSDECRQAVLTFFQKQKKFKQIQAQFSEMKAKFYNDMEDYFECNDVEGKLTLDAGVDFGSITVSRVQSSKIEFNPDKLEKALGKEIARDVIQKHYEITDMSGLICYLQECEVDPKVFKSFVSIRKTVNVKELDRLEELGIITAEQIKGCYTVKCQNPFFTIHAGKGQDE